jgi:hypothetical protein
MLVAVFADHALLGVLPRSTTGLVRCDNTGDALRALAAGDTRLVVIDEDALLPGFCDCVIAGARQFTPAAKIIYVTSHRNAGARRRCARPACISTRPSRSIASCWAASPAGSPTRISG